MQEREIKRERGREGEKERERERERRGVGGIEGEKGWGETERGGCKERERSKY